MIFPQINNSIQFSFRKLTWWLKYWLVAMSISNTVFHSHMVSDQILYLLSRFRFPPAVWRRCLGSLSYPVPLQHSLPAPREQLLCLSDWIAAVSPEETRALPIWQLKEVKQMELWILSLEMQSLASSSFLPQRPICFRKNWKRLNYSTFMTKRAICWTWKGLAHPWSSLKLLRNFYRKFVKRKLSGNYFLGIFST